MKLGLLVIKTSRVEECKEFYSTLGIKFHIEKHGTGPEHYAAELDNGVVLEIYPRRPGSVSDGNNIRLSFEIEDLEKTLWDLNSDSSIRVSPLGRLAVVKDPDDRTIELLCPGK